MLAAAAALFGYLEGGPRLDAWTRARLRAELARALGRPVSIGAVHVSPLSCSFEARDIVVGESPPGTGRVLELPLLSGTIAPREIWRGRLEFVRLRAERPRVFFTRRGGEPARWEGPFPTESKSRGEGTAGKPATGPRLVLRRLEVSEGLVSLDEQAVPIWFKAEQVEVSWDGDTSGNGRGTFESASFRGPPL